LAPGRNRLYPGRGSAVRLHRLLRPGFWGLVRATDFLRLSDLARPGSAGRSWRARRLSAVAESNPFTFYTERRLVTLTGFKARNLNELLVGLQEVSGSSIFYHTHHQYLAHHFVRPRFLNDFALWASEALQEERLAEQLSAIDLLQFTSIRALREAIIDSIDRYLIEIDHRQREAPPGDLFHFSKSMSFVMSTRLMALDCADFLAKLPHVTNESLYYHFFEARLRLGRKTNDFSFWLEGCGASGLARAIDELDPYIRTLDELRGDIIALTRRYSEKGS
jgi:hypothetical protein